MDISIEKQKIHREIDKINDESIILALKKLLGLAAAKSLTPPTSEQLVERALESERAIATLKTISLEELEKEMKNW